MLILREQVIHKNFKISRIRNFYMRKVKFTQDSFDEKLGSILEEFPIIDVSHSPSSYAIHGRVYGSTSGVLDDILL